MSPRNSALSLDAVSPIPLDVDPSAAAPDPGVLERIFLPEVAVAVWRRAVSPALERALDAWSPPAERVLLHRFTVPASGAVVADDLVDALAPLPAGDARTALARELAALAELYAILADAGEIGLRLSLTRGRPCPRFHVDRVGLRLICTLRGPGTEWLAHGDVDRHRLGIAATAPHAAGDEGAALRPGATIHRLAAGDVGVFKGDAWPGNAGRGIVHRSPPTDGSWRLLVSLDAL